MKPTQQEIIEFAKQATLGTALSHGGGELRIFIEGADWHEELLRFVEMLLERFGACGGEPSRDMPHGWVTNWPAPNGGTRPVYHASAIKPKYGPELDNSLVSYPVFTRPGSSPTDLRAEYLRGLEEGFKEGWIECSKWAQRDDLIADIGSPSYEACVSAVKALKGKQ